MGLGQFFKDLFGSAKETASKTADKTEVVFDEAKIKASEYAGKAEVYVEEKVKDIKEAYPEMAEKVERYTEKAKDVVSEYAEKIGDKVEDVVEDVRRCARVGMNMCSYVTLLRCKGRSRYLSMKQAQVPTEGRCLHRERNTRLLHTNLITPQDHNSHDEVGSGHHRGRRKPHGAAVENARCCLERLGQDKRTTL